MEQNPFWDYKSPESNQETTNILWNPKADYRVYWSKPLASTLSQMNLVHCIACNFFKIHFIAIIKSTASVFRVIISFGVSPPKNCIHFSPLPSLPHVQHSPTGCPQFYHHNVIFERKIWRYQSYFFQPPVTSLILNTNISFSILLPKNPQTRLFNYGKSQVYLFVLVLIKFKTKRVAAERQHTVRYAVNTIHHNW